MKTFQEVISAFAGLILGLAFFIMIAWEYSTGFAAGSFGGAEVRDNPGVFWFLIALQLMFGFLFFSRFTKGIGKILSAHFQVSHLADSEKMKVLIAVYRVTQLAALCLLGILGIWAIIDLSLMFYSAIKDRRIMDRVIFGGLAILCTGTFITLLFQLLLLPFLKDLFPGARNSAKLLIHEIESWKIPRKKK